MTPKNHRTAAPFLAKSSLVLLLLVIFAATTWQYLLSSPTVSTESLSLTIPAGSSVLRVGQLLQAQNLIRSPRVFQLYVRTKHLSIQAGDYQLTPSSLPELARVLTKGRDSEIRLTIPEGLRREEIAELVSTKLGLPRADFLSSTKDLEGKLFPDTYAFNEGVTVAEVVKRLQDTFAQKTHSLDLTSQDLILASIVEREALTDAEKPIVAGILHKRLAEGWALEVDATIQYIMGKSGEWWPTPLLGDRARKSAYNTYLNRGLPPTPISNPGLVALQAAADPIATPYYFYLHDKNGVIHYAITNAEHEANIAKYIH